MRRFASVALAVLAIAGGIMSRPPVARAGPDAWTSFGPPASTIQALAVDPMNPNRLYAGTVEDGVFATRTAGQNWYSASTGIPPNTSVHAIVVDPVQPNIVFAGTDGPGLFRSTDYGATWVPRNDGLSAAPFVRTIAIDPARHRTIYVGMLRGDPSQGALVYRSTDGGVTWRPMDRGLEGVVFGLAIDPTDPATIYAATNPSGIFKTTDGGRNWELASDGLPEYTVDSVLIDPSNPQVLYSGQSGYGVFRSDDGAATWTLTGPGPKQVISLAIDPVTPTTVYAGTAGDGALRSDDGGGHWIRINEGLPLSDVLVLQIHAMAVDPVDPDVVYLGSNRGGSAYRSADRGENWSPIRSGLSGSCVGAAVDPTDSLRVYATSVAHAGVFASTDGGRRWSRASHGLAVEEAAYGWVVVDPVEPENLYVPAIAPGGFGIGGVWASTDAGASWHRASHGLTNPAVFDVSIDPTDHRTIYAATGLNGGIFVSHDGAGTWDRLGPPGGTSTVAAAPGELLAGTFGSQFVGPRLYRSTDGGDTWTTTYEGELNWNISSIAIDPFDPDVAFASQWLSFFTGGMVASTDGGVTWEEVSGLDGQGMFTVAFDPAHRGTVYAGGYGGVVASTDGGATWTQMNEGLTNTWILTLSVSTDGRRLYAGTCGGGVFDLELPA